MSTERPETNDGRVRCPQCQTTRLNVLNRLDRIEKLYGNRLMNRMRARRGDTIYHCIYCRLQFYDPRKPGTAVRETRPERSDGSPDKTEAEQPAPPIVRVAAPKSEPAPVIAPIAPPKSEPAPALDGTFFGPAVTVRGSVQSQEDIYVDCRIDGTLACRTHRIVIGPHGKVKANIRAADLEVRGTLRGNLHVESKTTLRAGSSVVGDIRTADIIIEDGATFKGSVDLIRIQPQLPLG